MPIRRGHSPEVETRTLYHLIRMTDYRRTRLAKAKHVGDRKLIAVLGRELHAVTWALDKLGYPPSRYQEVIDRYRNNHTAPRSIGPDDAGTREPVPVEVAKSRRLWQQVREEEGF